MTIIRVQVNIRRASLLPADDCINTWHFQSVAPATNPLAIAAALAQLTAFYQAIDANYAAYVTSPAVAKFYDLADPEPRVPQDTENITLSVGVGAAYPAEVAICLSYRGELLSGTNPARRRGRIFLGPLDVDSGTTGTNETAVSSTARSTIATAANTMVTTGLTDDAQWVVFSPTLAGPPPWSEAVVEASSTPVVAGFVDNAFDTIRSRGALATARNVWP